MGSFVIPIAAGLMLAIVYAASPLAVWVAVAGTIVFAIGLRGLADTERRTLRFLLAVAILARLAFVFLVFVKNIPLHHDQWLGELTGDGAYGLSRALRARDLLLGVPTNKYDSFVVTDTYGQNAYVTLLTVLQTMFGPVPYGIRLLNGVVFLAGALVLFRFTRSAYGRLPAFAALAVALFLPSFFVWSVSLLKEPLYFFCTAVFLVSAARSLRAGPPWTRAGSGALALATLLVMEGVRHKTLAIGLLGWAVAAALMVVLSRPRRYVPLAIGAGIAGLALLGVPAVQDQVRGALAESAKIHAGHVFTLGHGYKLLDEGFYYRVQDPNSSTLTLTMDEAARYVVRAVASFVVTPLPWHAVSVRELAYVPEQIVWYILVAFLPIGLVVGWRLDAAITAVLIGYLIPTSLVLALTNGNVGTLVRLRGMVMIVVVWISAVGLCAVLDALAARRDAHAIGVPWGPARPEIAS
jgi:hypothetical protein